MLIFGFEIQVLFRPSGDEKPAKLAPGLFWQLLLHGFAQKKRRRMSGVEPSIAIETPEHKGDFKRPRSIASISLRSLPRSENELGDLIAAVRA